MTAPVCLAVLLLAAAAATADAAVYREWSTSAPHFGEYSSATNSQCKGLLHVAVRLKVL